MPLYEYKCNECELVFEVRQKFSDPLITECKVCNGKVEKLVSGASFALKGGGWYDQGYSDKAASCAAASASTGPCAASS